MVFDQKQGFALEHVDNPQGRPRRYGKLLVPLMVRRYKDGDPGDAGTPSAFEPPSEPGDPPEKLFRALFWEREAEILFTLHSPLLEKMKLIGMYILIFVLLIFIFLIFSSLGGA